MGKVSKDVGVVITAATRFPSSRRPPHGHSPNERRHIRHIGEVVHAWNTAHDMLYQVFALALAEKRNFFGDMGLAHALWHTVQSDKTQREMVAAVVKEKIRDQSNREAILWAISALNDLATYRNDAAHVPIMTGHPDIYPNYSAKPGSVERWEKSPIAEHWRMLRGDLYALANYLQGVCFALGINAPRPLSRRPRLLLARATDPRTHDRRRLAKKRARERQRQSSRE
jgi:hypothetical protein